ncbi:MAG: four helix bundle protein [Candidatus Schekmanbacteria bacterium]|nr:four helix bundle protein [Candidatus Schekmanbacteria bacterium]
MPAEVPKLHHENLDCYQTALSLLALATRLLKDLPRRQGELGDQLRRATISIPPGIAEGHAKRSPRDRSRSYDSARGSATESGAILDAARILGALDEERYAEGKTMLHRLVCW